MEAEGIDTKLMESTKTKIQHLPAEVLDYLVSFLDYSTRRACRLVSHTLKASVDGVGISVKLDSRKRESVDLCRNVNVTEVRVQHLLHIDPNLNMNMKKWKTVILSGPIDSSWLNNSLQRKCVNLRVLFLDASCLTSRDFGEPLLDVPIFEHLTQIHFYTFMYFTHFPRNDLFENTMEFNTRLDRNMVYLLGSLRSRVLKVLRLNVFTRNSFPLVDRNEDCWENEALLTFIQNHRNSLEELNGSSPRFPVKGIPQVYQGPTQLKQFSWNIVPFWKNVLLAQVSLEKLCLEFTKEDVVAVSLLLKMVFLNNSGTLTTVVLQLTEATTVTVMDMSIFSNLERLQKVAIYDKCMSRAVNPFRVINLNQLPRTRLTSLILIVPNIAEDFDGIQFMDGFRPKILTLKNISMSGQFNINNQHYMRNFVKLVLRSRSLNALDITFIPPNFESIGLGSPDTTLLYRYNGGLKFWLANQANQSAQDPMNYCVGLDMTLYPDRNRTCQNPDWDDDDDDDGTSQKVEHMELVWELSKLVGYQEQPLNLPRNVESYTIWTSLYDDIIRILPDPQATTRVNDIKRVNIRVRVTGQTQGGGGVTKKKKKKKGSAFAYFFAKRC